MYPGSYFGRKGDNVRQDKSRYIIVGASAAGMAAAHTIRLHDRQGSVTVFSEEPDTPYYRPLIPFLVSGKKRSKDMALAGCGPYTGRDITVRTGARVESVNTAEKIVSVQGSGGLAYEKILFATGSRPYIPPEINGADAKGVFALRTLAHARNMVKRVETSDHAVMLGGGLLNLKVAFALLERGLKVTLVVYSPEVLSRLMEPEDAFLLRNAMDKAGLKIKTGCAATHIIADRTGVTGVVLDPGGEMSCHMVCIGKGVRPNVEFLEGSHVRIEKGIVTDRYTACSAPDAFAAGDVAVTFNPGSGDRIMTALWTNAVEMGRCAGRNMAGVKTAYSGTLGILNATQVAGEPFVSMGVVHAKDHDFEIYRHATETTYRKVVFNPEGTRLIGAVFIGDITNAGLYRYVIREKMPVMHIKRYIIDHTLHYGHFVTGNI
ncbi:MAG: NAD(P)/FAD-dependent oxidoreductase [Deltaproteobacteria bacterium]|nr:MAG: NAD(P)/FAD-dependent oxidoreductase [Deltaproteobacteria bacterium]